MKSINLICPEDAVERVRLCLPSGMNKIGDVQFSINGMNDAYDGLIVLQSTKAFRYGRMTCRKGNSLLVVREPQDVLRIPQSYVNQFSLVLSPNQRVTGNNTIQAQFGQLWSLSFGFRELASMMPPTKLRNFSTVTSMKALTKGHKNRVEMLKEIQRAMPDQLDWYGRGVREIDDKWQAIEPYRYHLVFENGRWPDYWTEKLTDAYLGYSMPIYVGCPNIRDYFSNKSMVVLDSNDPDIVIPQLKLLLDENKYEKSLSHILLARDKILNEYSLFKVLMKIIDQNFNFSETKHTEIDLGRFQNTVYRSSIRKTAKRVIGQIAARKSH